MKRNGTNHTWVTEDGRPLDIFHLRETNVCQKSHSLYFLYITILGLIKVNMGAKIRNRYNQVPHLTQDTNGKVTNSQLDTTNESQEVSPFKFLFLKKVKLRTYNNQQKKHQFLHLEKKKTNRHSQFVAIV